VILQAEDETFKWLGYDLDTGNLLWGPVGDDDFRAFQLYGGGEGNGQIGYAAYGNLYVQGYGGEIHCYDTETGNLEWEYSGSTSGIETAWGDYPIFISAIADGKVYAFNNEHSPNTPYYKGERIYCIDAFSGEELWTLLGWSGQTGGRGTSTAVLADGFLCYINYYDNQVYCVGKGSSATTVNALPKVIENGSGVLIEGMVTDISPGTKQNEQAVRFPEGVPAVSDTSMSAWMEYVYMQKPKPEDVTGVPVKLAYQLADGTWKDIDQVMTDEYGYFGFTWAPPDEGTYLVKAFFLGSESYWGSSDVTYVGVGPSPAMEEPQDVDLSSVEDRIDSQTIYILVILVIVILALVIAIYSLMKSR
jgi:hypothetical protein